MDNTIFDDVFRTLLEKMPQLAIPLINEVFGTSYSENEKIIQLRNEHETAEGVRITDCSLLIGKKIYHIECQSSPDSVMVIRMVEYDFYIARERVTKQGDGYVMEFPHSCVLYLRHNSNTKDVVSMELRFADGSRHIYKVPVIKVQEYTKDVLFQKKLLFLLPFYVMRYEKEKEEINQNEKKLSELLEEYECIRRELDKSLGEGNHSKEFADLIEMIIRISDYIFRDEEKVKKGVGEIMGGKVLELKSDKIYDEGLLRGRIEAYHDVGCTLEEISVKVGISAEEVQEYLRKAQKK